MVGRINGDPAERSALNKTANEEILATVASAAQTYNVTFEITLPVDETPCTLSNADSAGKGTIPAFRVNLLPLSSSSRLYPTPR